MKLTVYGPEHGPAILCIPGVFMTGECFSRLADHMPDCRLVCVTLDGHYAGSPDFESLEAETEKLECALLEAGWDRFSCGLGVSIGTLVILELARRGKVRLEKIWLDGAVNLYSSGMPKLEAMAMSAIFSAFRKSARKNQTRGGKPRGIFTEDWNQKTQGAMAAMSDASMEHIIQALCAYAPRPGITVPMHCIYGSLESNISVNRRQIQKCWPQATVALKHGYSHTIYLDREPERYAWELAEFLAQ